MIDIILLVLLLFIVAILPNRIDGYLAPENTLCAKGLLCIFVVLHHTFQHTTTGNFFNYLYFMGRYAVASFFFLSGYSLCTQISERKNYLKHFLRKRLGKLLLPYIVIAAIYIVFWKLTYDPNYGFQTILVNFPKNDTIISNGWFMISIVVFYIFFYLSFLLCKKRYAAITVCTLAILAYSVLLLHCGYGFHWYNANLAFPLGLIWACHKETFDRLSAKHMSFLMISAVTILFFWHNYRQVEEVLRLSFHLPDIWYSNFSSIGFVILLMLLLQKINLQHPLFRFYGKISMEIYLIHGMFIFLFSDHRQSHVGDLLFALQILIFSTLAALALHALFGRIGQYLHHMK